MAGANKTTISWKLQEKKKVKGRRKLTRLQLKEEVEGNLKEVEKGEVFAEDCIPVGNFEEFQKTGRSLLALLLLT